MQNRALLLMIVAALMSALIAAYASGKLITDGLGSFHMNEMRSLYAQLNSNLSSAQKAGKGQQLLMQSMNSTEFSSFVARTSSTADKSSNPSVSSALGGNFFDSQLKSSTEVYSSAEAGNETANEAASIPTTRKVDELGLKIVAYGLYGDDRRYLDGAHANADLMSTIYPGWTMRVYYDNTVPQATLDFLREHNVDLVDMSNDGLRNKMSWRFLPAGESNVNIFISRDIDSRLSVRERRAVQEWEESGQTFHVLRDHPSHSRFAVSGGMWGSKSNAIPDIRQRLERSALQHAYLADMNFLNSEIWPLMVRAGVMVHDAFSCDRAQTRPFPTARIGTEHVGSVYLNGVVRKGDADILQNAINRGEPKC